MELVLCDEKYWEFVRVIRTHPKNIDNFNTKGEITVQQQREFMEKNSHRYQICLLNGKPVGYIALGDNNKIQYCVHPDYQGKGIGTFMVKELFDKIDELQAYVKVHNIPSQKVFEKIGFKKFIYYKK